MSLEALLRQRAREIADAIQRQIPTFEKHRDEHLAEVDEAQTKLDSARASLKRATSFPNQFEGDYCCPRCWVERDVRTKLRPLTDDDGNDVFECHRCYLRVAFPVRPQAKAS